MQWAVSCVFRLGQDWSVLARLCRCTGLELEPGSAKAQQVGRRRPAPQDVLANGFITGCSCRSSEGDCSRLGLPSYLVFSGTKRLAAPEMGGAFVLFIGEATQAPGRQGSP